MNVSRHDAQQHPHATAYTNRYSHKHIYKLLFCTLKKKKKHTCNYDIYAKRTASKLTHSQHNTTLNANKTKPIHIYSITKYFVAEIDSPSTINTMLFRLFHFISVDFTFNVHIQLNDAATAVVQHTNIQTHTRTFTSSWSFQYDTNMNIKKYTLTTAKDIDSIWLCFGFYVTECILVVWFS